MIRVHRSGPARAAETAVRLTKVALATATLVLVVIDGGSCALAAMSVSDTVKDAGRAAVSVAVNQPVNYRTATQSYQAAQQVASDAHAQVVTDGDDGFALQADRSVTLTITRTAPTLLMGHIGPLKHYSQARASWTAHPATY